MKPKVYFRADAGAEIGYGHFVRTLALVDMIRDDFDCTFFTQCPTSYQRREVEKVCKLTELPADDSKFDIFLDCLRGDEIVILDNYFFTEDYQRLIKRKGCMLICIDDMHDRHYVADIVINHGITDSSQFRVEPYTKLCLGLDWALLRSPFLSSSRTRIKEYTGNAVICFGGSDPNDLTGKVLKAVISDKNIKSIKAVVGDAYHHPRENNDARVEYYSNLSADEMCAAFSTADIVICSASTVCIEALFCGARVAAGWYADNQREFYHYLENSHYILPLGCLAGNIREISVENIDTEAFPPVISQNVKKRYANLFRDLAKGIYLRQARNEDLDILYEWINDREVRQNSFSTGKISYEEHVQWFRQAMDRKNVSVYIMVSGSEPVGTVRFEEKAEGAAVISCLVARPYRNTGLGKKLIELAMDEIELSTGIQKVEAYVKDENQKSKYILKKCGFKEDTKNKLIYKISR